MDTTLDREHQLARPRAPEDVRRGDYVSVLHVVGEHLCCEQLAQAQYRSVEPVRIAWLPFGDPTPMKVLEVCLPFVLVREADGAPRTLDTRRYRLARVTEEFARKAFKRLKLLK